MGLACLSWDKGIILFFFLGPGKTVTQVPSTLGYFSVQISPSGHTTDLQRHVLIQSAADKLFLVLSFLNIPVTTLLLAEANAERQTSGAMKPD